MDKTVLIVTKNDYTESTVKDILGYDIDILASGLYSPIRNFGGLSEPCATPTTPPMLFSLNHSSSYDSSFMFRFFIN